MRRIRLHNYDNEKRYIRIKILALKMFESNISAFLILTEKREIVLRKTYLVQLTQY